MTREEAITKYIVPAIEKIWNDKKCKEILEALEQEPCGDCVSRQAVLEYIEGSEAELGYSSENELVCQYIKELPPVKTEPKTGHWIRIKTYEKWRCSECSKVFRFTFKEHDYCPNCGARMESEDKE